MDTSAVEDLGRALCVTFLIIGAGYAARGTNFLTSDAASGTIYLLEYSNLKVI